MSACALCSGGGGTGGQARGAAWRRDSCGSWAENGSQQRRGGQLTASVPAEVVGLDLEAAVNEFLLSCGARRRQAGGGGPGSHRAGRARRGARAAGENVCGRHSAENTLLTCVRRGLGHLVDLAVLQNLEQRGLAGAVEAEEEHLGVLVVQACERTWKEREPQAPASPRATTARPVPRSAQTLPRRTKEAQDIVEPGGDVLHGGLAGRGPECGQTRAGRQGTAMDGRALSSDRPTGGPPHRESSPPLAPPCAPAAILAAALRPAPRRDLPRRRGHGPMRRRRAEMTSTRSRRPGRPNALAATKRALAALQVRHPPPPHTHTRPAQRPAHCAELLARCASGFACLPMQRQRGRPDVRRLPETDLNRCWCGP